MFWRFFSPVKGGTSLFLLQAIHHRPKPTGMQVQPDAYISLSCLIDIFRIKQTAAVYAAISLFQERFLVSARRLPLQCVGKRENDGKRILIHLLPQYCVPVKHYIADIHLDIGARWNIAEISFSNIAWQSNLIVFHNTTKLLHCGGEKVAAIRLPMKKIILCLLHTRPPPPTHD